MKGLKVERKKATRVFFPIKSVKRGVDSEGREFRVPEGYCFVNEWVGDGVNLKRSAMVAASDDYMRWGAVREMHQPSAVGTATGTVEVTNDQGAAESLPLGVFWDDRGAFLRCKVVDPDAIHKLDEQVYKGFSVSIRAKVMRGIDVESCEWIENSLVDRPADPDAAIDIIRAEGVDPDGEFDVIRYGTAPKTFAEMIPGIRGYAADDLFWESFYALSDSWWLIEESEVADPGTLMAQSVDEFAAFVKSDIIPMRTSTERAAAFAAGLKRARANFEAAKSAEGNVSRLNAADADLAEAKRLLNAKEGEVTALRAKLDASEERARQLERLPDPTQPKPVRTPAERSFLADLNPGSAVSTEAVRKLEEEIAELTRSLETEADAAKREAGVVKLQVLKRAVANADPSLVPAAA